MVPTRINPNFSLLVKKQPHLDMKYTLFGKVIDGFDTLEELVTINVDAKYRSLVQQKIQSVTIHTNPLVVD